MKVGTVIGSWRFADLDRAPAGAWGGILWFLVFSPPAGRAGAFEESPKILARAHAVARLQRGRRDQGPVEEVLLEEPARFLERGFHGPAFFALRGIRLAATGQRRQQAPGGEHDDPGHTLAVLEGEAHGDAPGLRMAYETRLRKAQGIHECEDEARAIGDGKVPGVVAQAEPGLIAGDHPQAVRCEVREIPRPDVSRGAERRPVQQEDRRPAPLLEGADAQPLHLDEILLHRRSAMSSSTPSGSAR